MRAFSCRWLLPKRNIVQFSLRTLLLLVLVAACFFAWIRHRSEQWKRAVGKLEGTWEVVDSNIGEPPDSLEFHESKITWTSKSSGGALLRCSMPFLADSNEIDIVREDGIRLPARYAVEGDTLTLVHGQPRARPPDSLEDSPDWPIIRITLRKVATSDAINESNGVSP